MLKSRSIRIAVNLCVTGSLLLPGGGIGLAGTVSCHASASTMEKCAGCGRCSVSEKSLRCDCCSRTRQAAVAQLTSSQARGCCHPTPDQATSDAAMPEKDHGICICGLDPQPARPVPNDRSETEQHVKLLLASATVAFVVTTDDRTLLASHGGSHSPTFSPRDSQRQLCVWLI